VKAVGKGPAAIGRLLDWLATVPVIGWGVWLFSSVVFGLVVLGLIGLYIAIGSGFANLRATLEMTDLEFFNAWPMRVLLALLVLDLSVVTLRRIPLTLFKLGSWTVHIGILTLIAGCVWYFSCKQEGSVRIYLNQSVDACYDVTERALYAFKVNDDGTFDQDHPAITRLPGLPIYYEHLAERGNGLNREVPGSLATLNPAAKDVQVRVVGYYPSAIMRDMGWRPASPGEKGSGPGVGFVLTDGKETLPEAWLVGSIPAARILDDAQLPMAIEYLHHPTPERVRELQASFDGTMGLTVRIPSLNIEQTYTAKAGTPIVVEGSPYTLTPKDVNSIQMASEGYKGASSSMLMVGVSRKDGDKVFEYDRQAVFRFPERSPDWVTENGQRKRVQAGVDPNIQIQFHDASKPQIWIVEGADGAMSVIYRDVTGRSVTPPLKDGAATIALSQFPPFTLKITGRGDSVARQEPWIIPAEQRPRGQTAMDAMQLSMIELEVRGTGPQGAWKRGEIFVPFSPYAAIGEAPVGQKPAVVDVPGVGRFGFLLATTKRALPAEVTLKDFKPVHYPGASRAYEDYISTIEVKDKDTGKTETLVAQLNGPAEHDGLFYFQSAWDGDDHAPPAKRFTVLGVANRPGVYVMTAGSILIVLGIGFAFYAKPILLKKKKEQLAAWAKSGN
jgi:hypothetical protein